MKKLLLLMATLLTGLLLQAQGIYQLWGMTPYGGQDNNGTIFKTNAANDYMLTIHSFPVTNQGSSPEYTALIEFNGKFYGMTFKGGTSESGVIFEWDPVNKVYNKKIDFDGIKGKYPYGGLTLSNNKFYGTTMYGGINDAGVIFEWDPATNIYTKKFDFTAADGDAPMGDLIQKNGKFYGNTQRGGNNNAGVIFEWDLSTKIYTKKFDFDGTNGKGPVGSMTQGPDGKLYGMTAEGGGGGGGVIFKWDPTTNAFSKEFDFGNYENNTTGYSPLGKFILNHGKLYGTTLYGGRYNNGVIFEWDPAIKLFTRKIDFNSTNGSAPIGGLTFSNGKFYGTTKLGGVYYGGVIFEWEPVSNVYTKKIDLEEYSGINPVGGLLLSNNKFYGLTEAGGNNNAGVIFEWDLYQNSYTNLLDFGDNSKGYSHPAGSLIQVGSKLYGMLPSGGTYGLGVIFELDLYTHLYTVKTDFDGINGASPMGSLTFKNGKFYGITYSGGTNDAGVIFEWDPLTNNYIKKIDLNEAKGTRSFGNLTCYLNKFYGMTLSGGASNEGVIFEWDPAANIYTKRVDLNKTTGNIPFGSLTLKGDKFYGMTSSGGINGSGVLFEWDPATNIYTKKIDLKNYGDNPGANPTGNLTLKDEKFYGLTSAGGVENTGVIFEWDPVANIFSKRVEFSGIYGPKGSYPGGSLTLKGGKFYGMTSSGGINGSGVLFEWDPATNVYIKKIDLTYWSGTHPSSGNNLTLVKAPVSIPQSNTCITFPYITIDSTNNNQWVSITDEDNNAVAEIKANGNNLGVVTASVFINNGKVREDGTGRLYLDRSITLTTQYPQKSAVDIRLYIKGSEYTALKNAHNFFGQTAGINSINDVGIFKIKGGCAPAAATISNLISTSGAAWENDYVLSASVNSFTSFYFASNNPCAAPVISAVSASTSSLSPADHQMKNVTINYSAKGNCFPITTWLTVTSNEPVSGTGNGDLSPDWIIMDDHHLQLRAERSVSGTGRTYTITVNAKNTFGTYCKKTIKLVVTALPVTLAKAADGNNENELFDCKVIPNPTSNYFNLQIQSASTQKIEVILLDISGRLISKWTTVKGETNRFGENLKPGVYTVNVIHGQQQYMLKIVKQ